MSLFNQPSVSINMYFLTLSVQTRCEFEEFEEEELANKYKNE